MEHIPHFENATPSKHRLRSFGKRLLALGATGPNLSPNEGELRRKYAWPLAEYERIMKPHAPDDISSLDS